MNMQVEPVAEEVSHGFVYGNATPRLGFAAAQQNRTCIVIGVEIGATVEKSTDEGRHAAPHFLAYGVVRPDPITGSTSSEQQKIALALPADGQGADTGPSHHA